MSNKYAEPEPHLDLFQRGYDNFGQSNLLFSGGQVNQRAGSMYDAGVPSNFIMDGDIVVRLNVIDGYLQSDNFVTGVSGWQINSDGEVEFESGTFRGDIVGATITGSTIWAKNTGVGIDVKIGSDGGIRFYFAGTEVGQISAAAAGTAIGMYGKTITFVSTVDAVTAGKDSYLSVGVDDVTLKAEDDLTLQSKSISLLKTTGASGQVQLKAQETGGDVTFSAGENTFIYETDAWVVQFNADSDGSECQWTDIGNTDLVMRLTAPGVLTADGSITGGGADYAELFESINGEKIPNGISVILEDGKIREAEEGEVPFGVISPNPNVLGNVGGQAADTAWKGKYLRNKDGSYVMEKSEFWSIRKVENEEEEPKRLELGGEQRSGWSDRVEAPKNAKKKMATRKKINSDWKPEDEYVSRVDRNEWNAVGILGQLLVKKGSPVAPNWILIKEENDEYDKYLIK